MKFQAFTGECSDDQEEATLRAMKQLDQFLEDHPDIELEGISTAAAMTSHVVPDDFGSLKVEWWHAHTITICYQEAS